jgi:hypothetical protein
MPRRLPAASKGTKVAMSLAFLFFLSCELILRTALRPVFFLFFCY